MVKPKRSAVEAYRSVTDLEKEELIKSYLPLVKRVVHRLSGRLPKDVDKKKLIWDKVNKREPQINWLLDKKGQLKKENFDMSDSYTVMLAFAHMKEIFE